MTLAVDKQSPIPGSAIFWSNFGLTLKAIFITVGGLLAYSGFTDSNNSYLIASGFFIVTGLWRFYHSYGVNIALRRARYRGLYIFTKRKMRGILLPQWIPTFPWAIFSRVDNFQKVMLLFEKNLKTIASSENYAQFVLYSEGSEDFSLRLIHHCDGTGECESPELHLFGYSESE